MAPRLKTVQAAAGDVDLNFPVPGADNVGSIDTTTDLGSAAHLWLRGDWDNGGSFSDDPSALATFGVYQGIPVQILYNRYTSNQAEIRRYLSAYQ